jgi:predicted Zn-dependent protease
VTERALEIAERALEHAGGAPGDAIVHLERSGFARFAGSEIHQPTLVDDAVVELRLVDGAREGIASTNRVSDEGLAELARRARDVLASAAEREEAAEPAAPADLPPVEGWDDRTAELSAADLAAVAGAAIGATDLPLYGYATAGACELAVASTAGARAWQRFTDVTCLALAAGDGASGYASATSWRAAGVDAASVAAEAAAKAERTRGAVELPPAKLRAVLEPYAIAELLLYFAFDSLNGLGLLEERSFFAGRLGEPVFDPRVTLADDALDPVGLPKSFDFEAVPKSRVPLVEEGVARDVVWDRTTAARAGRASTGHALRPAERAYGPLPLALSLAPGEAASTDELAELVADGIYVTRLHYLSVVDPREGVITGMTRDGTFRIRNGAVAEPLVNLRFTVSMPELLADVPGLTSTVALVNASDFYDARYPYAYRVPAIATGAFNVTGTGSGPGL